MKIFDSPVILFNKKFDEESLGGFMQRFSELERDEEEKVTILINSPGGSLDVLKTMLDVIYNTDMFVITAASGLAASCGFALLMAGDHRMAFSGTMLMSHQYSWGSRGKHHELEAVRKAQDMTHTFMMDHYRLHTGLPEARIRKELLPAEDTWLSAQEALDLSVIDTVIFPTGKPIGKVAKDKAGDRGKKVELEGIRGVVGMLNQKELAYVLKGTGLNEDKPEKTPEVEPTADVVPSERKPRKRPIVQV